MFRRIVCTIKGHKPASFIPTNIEFIAPISLMKNTEYWLYYCKRCNKIIVERYKGHK